MVIEPRNLSRLFEQLIAAADSPEPELGWNFSDTTLEDAWYALEEMIIWARTFDDRLRHPAHDRRTYPDQGLIPALAASPRREAIITARFRLVGAYLNEVRYLAQLNLHMQSTKAGSVQARVRDGQLVLRFPDRVAGWISHRWLATQRISVRDEAITLVARGGSCDHSPGRRCDRAGADSSGLTDRDL